jgi:hypothetical protein
MAVEVSLPSFHVTGPVHLVCRTPAHVRYSGAVSSKIWYLGTNETQPQVKHQVQKLDVFNDIGGRKVPMQQLEQGEIGLLGFLLTRFSQTGYTQVRKAGGKDGTGLSANGLGVGYEGRYARGLFAFASTSVDLWRLYESGYGAETPGVAGPNTTPGLPRGRYYPNANLIAHEIADSGTAAEKLLLVFQAMPLWLGPTAVGELARGWALYSESETDFPSDIILANVQ